MAERGRPKKNNKCLNVYVNVHVLEELDKYNDETGVPKSVVVEKALIQYLGLNTEDYKETNK